MKMGFVTLKASPFPMENLMQIESLTKKYPKVDLLLFGEGFLQGPDWLTFDYQHDIPIASGLYAEDVMRVRRIARENNCALGFGFYENDRGGIYNSYLIVGKKGEVLLKTQGFSKAWKAQGACADYREGRMPGYVELGNKRWCLLLGDDLLEEDYWVWLLEFDERADGFIWISHKKQERALKLSEIFAKPIYALTGEEVFFMQQGKVLKQERGGIALFNI